jgi:hypothetical protein
MDCGERIHSLRRCCPQKRLMTDAALGRHTGADAPHLFGVSERPRLRCTTVTPDGPSEVRGAVASGDEGKPAVLVGASRRTKMTQSGCSRPFCFALQSYYSIASSACSTIDCGTVRPSALALPRLMTISNLLARTGSVKEGSGVGAERGGFHHQRAGWRWATADKRALHSAIAQPAVVHRLVAPPEARSESAARGADVMKADGACAASRRRVRCGRRCE